VFSAPRDRLGLQSPIVYTQKLFHVPQHGFDQSDRYVRQDQEDFVGEVSLQPLVSTGPKATLQSSNLPVQSVMNHVCH